MEIDPETPTVEQLLEKAYKAGNSSSEDGKAFKEHLYDIFNLRYLLDKYIILLSSGELRKFVLCRALMGRPKKLIIDNPFIGLDSETREQLKGVLADMAHEHGLQIVLILTKETEVPDFITDIRRVESNNKNNMLEAHPEMVSELLAAQQQEAIGKSDDIVNLKEGLYPDRMEQENPHYSQSSVVTIRSHMPTMWHYLVCKEDMVRAFGR